MSLINYEVSSVKAFAPATSANFSVGFDIMGASLDGIGDILTLIKRTDSLICLTRVSGVEGSEDLPVDPHKNIATAVILRLQKDFKINFGFNVELEKGIPIGSGMGGSSASAVAAVIAFNGFLNKPLTIDEIIKYSLFGEAIASGTAHGDNVIPAIIGGFLLINSLDRYKFTRLPNLGMSLIIIHPDMEIKTSYARELLESPFLLKNITEHQQNLASVIVGLYTGNISLLKEHMVDKLIEPRRKEIIPFFDEVKNVALREGAISCSISGAGPAIFALSLGKTNEIAKAMQAVFINGGYKASIHVSSLDAPGASIQEVR
jgi:homoserine kinase